MASSLVTSTASYYDGRQSYILRVSSGVLLCFYWKDTPDYNNDLWYNVSSDGGVTWNNEIKIISDITFSNWSWFNVALDSSQNFYVAYYNPNASHIDVRKFTYSGGTWTDPGSDLTWCGITGSQAPFVMIHSDGTIWVSGGGTVAGNFKSAYSTDGGTSWTTSANINTGLPGFNDKVPIKLYEVGSEVWAFAQQYGSSAGKISLNKWNGSVWGAYNIAIDSPITTGNSYNYDACVISSTEVWLAYTKSNYGGATGYGIKVKKWNGSSWGNDYVFDTHYNWGPVAISKVSGKPVCAWLVYPTDMKYSYWDGSSWSATQSVTHETSDANLQYVRSPYLPTTNGYFYTTRQGYDQKIRFEALNIFGPVTRTNTKNSDAKILSLRGSNNINSSANIKKTNIQSTLDSNTKIINSREIETIDSDTIIKRRETNNILSSAIVIGTGWSTIDSDTNIINKRGIEDITSDGKVIGRYSTTIDSDGKIVLRETETINSNGKIILRESETIESSAVIERIESLNILADTKVVLRYTNDILSGTLIWGVKDFYTRTRLQKDNISDFSIQLKVTQTTPTNPIGLISTDLKTGEALKLSWTGSNYGWNIYKDIGGVWTKLNNTLVTDIYYIVGELVNGVTYTFKVTGVNGVGEESSGVTVVGTPTYDVTHYKNPIYQIYINGSLQTDAILENIELVYGPSFSTASFYIPKKFTTPGIPDASGQSVYININGHRVFTGYVVKKDDVLSANDIRVNYRCINKLWDYTKTTINKNFNERQGEHIETISINSILSSSGCPSTPTSVTLYGEVSVADMTRLELMINMLGYAGNYKVYCSPTGVLSYYKIGNPVGSRNYEIGKHILEYSMSKDITNNVDKVSVYSDYEARTTYRQQIGYETQIWADNDIGNRNKLNRNIQTDNDGNLYIGPIKVYGKNISNIQVEALVNDAPTGLEFLDIEVLPSHVGLDKWDDGSTNGKFPIVKYEEFSPEWRSIGAEVNYSHYGTYATIKVTPPPVRYKANIKEMDAEIHILTGGVVEKKTVKVKLMMQPIECLAAIRWTYTYQGERYSRTAGSGTVSRTIHDSIQPYYISTPNEYDTNTSIINKYLADRAQAEYDKVSGPVVGGSLTVLGDETLDLRTNVNGYEVMRVLHDFSNGFTTHIDLTDEQFYHGEAVMEQKEAYKSKSLITTNKSKTVELDYNFSRIANLAGLKSNPTTVKNPKSGIGHYSD